MTIENIAIVDTETTGLSPATDRVIEIGVVVWNVALGTTLKCWSTLVQNDSNAAEEVNRIPVGALKHALPFEDAVRTLGMFVEMSDIIVAHRSEFDSSFLPTVRQRPWVCSKMDLEWPHSKVGDGLVHIALANGVGVTHAHRALTDCLILARLFERVWETNGEDTVQGMLIRGMRPRAVFQAMVPFERKDEAKAAGFSWEPDRKRWVRRMAREDAAKLPFRVVEALT